MKRDDLEPGRFYKTTESRTVMLLKDVSLRRSHYGIKETWRAAFELPTGRVLNVALSQISRPATDEQVDEFRRAAALHQDRVERRKQVNDLATNDHSAFVLEHDRLKAIEDARRDEVRAAQLRLADAEEAFEPYHLRMSDERREAERAASGT